MDSKISGKTVAIMQPAYLPWMGYFALMDQVDVFVFLDSVQFAKRSWQQRNQIKAHNGIQLMTVPVISKSLHNQLICEVRIEPNSDFARKHVLTIEMAYKKAKYYKQVSDEIFSIISKGYEFLSDLNVALIVKIKEMLGIKVELLKSSLLMVEGTKAELLSNICKQLSADVYISPPGSRDYMEQSTSFQDRGIEVRYNNYEHPEYSQLHGSFIPYMSVIDLMFNEGIESLEIIRRGIQQ